ncbi:hypothetical protein BRETT_004461 [Brettanomyces bruxellensis]|uniref:Thioredoxin domain-containing protein n=1 Tax=Dekkera bruxellensis TaxID=5007 RepID=A0A871RAU2_DEKBR|nr:uncharacterized protein BRETT_004461 [Brettanomyces bruxellensis]QOU19240.1 hypothetical protein BRETT_004461 [Brettanomyces bruxellensis]
MGEITVGDHIPTNIKLGYIPYTPEHENICSIGRPISVDLSKILPGKTIVLVAAPGAFTPTCTERHIPGFVSGYKQLKDNGADEVYVLTTDNPFVQAAWGKALGNKGEVKFVSDPKGAFSAELGLASIEGDEYVPARTFRYAAVVIDGVVRYLGVEHNGSLDRSTFPAVLRFLESTKL